MVLNILLRRLANRWMQKLYRQIIMATQKILAGTVFGKVAANYNQMAGALKCFCLTRPCALAKKRYKNGG